MSQGHGLAKLFSIEHCEDISNCELRIFDLKVRSQETGDRSQNPEFIIKVLAFVFIFPDTLRLGRGTKNGARKPPLPSAQSLLAYPS